MDSLDYLALVVSGAVGGGVVYMSRWTWNKEAHEPGMPEVVGVGAGVVFAGVVRQRILGRYARAVAPGARPLLDALEEW